MTANRRVTGTASSMPAGLAIGAGVSLSITMVLSLLAAKLVDSGTLQEGSIGYCAMVILAVASLSGALIAWGKIKRQMVAVCSISGGIYYMMLLAMTAMCFGGQYQGMGVTALMVLCGVGLAILIGLRKGRGSAKRKPPRRKIR